MLTASRMRAFLILLIGLMGVVQIGPACSNCSVKDNWGFRQSCYQCGAPRPSKKAIALEKENVELRRKLAEKDGVKPTQDDGAADKDKAETPAELRKRCQALKEARKHLEQGGAAPELIASINSDIDKAEKQLQVDVPAGKQVTALNHQLKKLRQKDQKLADSLEANGEKLQQIKERMDDAVAQRAALKTDIEAAEREMQKAGVLLASQAAPPAEEHGYSPERLEANSELAAMCAEITKAAAVLTEFKQRAAALAAAEEATTPGAPPAAATPQQDPAGPEANMGGSTEESKEAEKPDVPEEQDDAADISDVAEKLFADALFKDFMDTSGLEGEARAAFEQEARAKATKQAADTLAHGNAKRRRRGL